MIDIIKPSIPVGGQEHVGRIKPNTPGDSSVQNIPDPSKVVKTNSQTVFTERQSEKWQPNFQSNFDQFLSILRNSPGLTESYVQMFGKMGSLVQSGIGEGFTKEIAAYMQLLNMTEGELLTFLKNQQGSAVKFTGPFFDMLRQVLSNSVSPDLKGAIVDFLQKYDSMSSGDHVLSNLLANLKNISAKIPASAGAELNALVAKLITPENNKEALTANGKLSDAANLQNVNVLKSEIIPFLSNYVGRTHDFGTVRDLISVFVLNLSRYETGTDENFSKAFRSLMGYPEIQNLMRGVDINDLERFFLNNKPMQGDSALVDKLISIISRGMSGEVGSQNKAVFQNVLNSFLLNESVYMPLVHITLPADVNGQKFFSEIWVDPNSKEGSDSEQGGGEAFKLMIKFDIRDVGFFETVMLVQNSKIDMQLFYPEQYEHLNRAIKEEVVNILTKNDLKVQSLAIGKLEKPKTISEVFPKIYEGRNVVNVSI